MIPLADLLGLHSGLPARYYAYLAAAFIACVLPYAIWRGIERREAGIRAVAEMGGGDG